MTDLAPPLRAVIAARDASAGAVGRRRRRLGGETDLAGIERMTVMLNEINQIKEWMKSNVGVPAPDGKYNVPIDGVLWVVTIKNDYVAGFRKATKDDIEDSSAWDAYDPT